MTGVAWESLALQAPLFLIFAIFVIAVVKVMMAQIAKQTENTQMITDKFIAFMTKRDEALNTTLSEIAKCLELHDRKTDNHDQFVHERFRQVIE